MSTYVYGFAHTSHPLQVDTTAGVGRDRPPLRVVRQGDLVAVVSDAPEDLRAKRRDLETHEAVLEALQAAGTVLPLRFGTVAPDDTAVRHELEASAQQYGDLLTRLDRKVELNVKASYAEDAVLRETLLRHRELRELNDRLRASGGGTYEDRLAFGERVAAAVQERQSVDAERILAELRPHAAASTPGPAVDGSFFNTSFLVGAGERAGFDDAVRRVQQGFTELVDVRAYGPLPPYSFVSGR
jgi:hypothetical protein